MSMPAVAALSRSFELANDSSMTAKKIETRRRGLRIGNLNLLVPHDSGGELIEDVRLFPLPRTAPWCRGLVNLRGQLVPAFDLHESLDLTRLRPARQWWLVLGRGEDAVAFAIDALPRLLSASTSAVVQSAVLPNALRPFIGGGFRIEDELWLEFDYRAYFGALTPRAAA